MGFLGFVKDVSLLPIEVTLDLTGVSSVMALLQGKEMPFRTLDRLKSIGENLDDTLRKDVRK